MAEETFDYFEIASKLDETKEQRRYDKFVQYWKDKFEASVVIE